LLDDQPEEALPISKALSRAGIPVAFFDGTKADLPKTNNKLRGVRLAILDMDLGVGGSAKNMASTLVGAFSQIIDRDSGTFCYFRPRYSDHLGCPASVEFGVLLPEGKLWSEQFQN
jgi:hypothetical protein